MEAENKQNETDADVISYNLSITPTERLLQHQAALETVLELEAAHKKLYAESQ